VFNHGDEVADNLGMPAARKGIGRLHVNAYEALILGHCAERAEELDLQFCEGALRMAVRKPRRWRTPGKLRVCNARPLRVRP
jgi:hypothetical protein